jgi:hypothetical protein
LSSAITHLLDVLNKQQRYADHKQVFLMFGASSLLNPKATEEYRPGATVQSQLGLSRRIAARRC